MGLRPHLNDAGRWVDEAQSRAAFALVAEHTTRPFRGVTLSMIRRGHPDGNIRLYHPGRGFPSAESSQWHKWWMVDDTRPENFNSRSAFPFPINITFTPEADVRAQQDLIRRELTLREVFRTRCPGLPRIDTHGWLAESVRDPAPPVRQNWCTIL